MPRRLMAPKAPKPRSSRNQPVERESLGQWSRIASARSGGSLFQSTELPRLTPEDREDLGIDREEPKSSSAGTRHIFTTTDDPAVAEWNRIWEEEYGNAAKPEAKRPDTYLRSETNVTTRVRRSEYNDNSQANYPRESRGTLPERSYQREYIDILYVTGPNNKLMVSAEPAREQPQTSKTRRVPKRSRSEIA